MPRPIRAVDLIELEPGAPEFRKGAWWTTYNEGRLFYPRGYAAALTAVGLNTIKKVLPYLKPAAVEIATRTEWANQLEDTKNWPKCGSDKLQDAASEAPMLLTKAAHCIVALELFVEDKVASADKIDVYDHIKLFPGQYAVGGLSAKVLQQLIDGRHPSLAAFEASARELAQEHPRNILWDVASLGRHVPFGIARLMHTHFDTVENLDIQLSQADRPASAGVSPASEWVRPYTAPPTDEA